MPWPYGVHAASRTTAGTSSTNAATSRLFPNPGVADDDDVTRHPVLQDAVERPP